MKINIMTASYSSGDAIGNYIKSQYKILNKLNLKVNIFSDRNDYKSISFPSKYYKSTGNDVLWFHYSIYSDNFSIIKKSNDFKIMDYHGITPPHLFKGFNRELESLTKRGCEYLKKYVYDFDLCIVHSDYTFKELEEHGYKNIIKIPLVVNNDIFSRKEDYELSNLLNKLEYMLFVGRIVPQKDIISIVKFYYELKNIREDLKLFLVGDTNFSKEYLRQIVNLIKKYNLEQDILITGKIINPSILISFYKNAKFSIYLSEWESFCVPIVESFFFNVPVIGINKTCIPETIGNAGILINGVNFQETAKEVNEVLEDKKEYKGLQNKCKLRVELFKENTLEKNMYKVLNDIIR